MVKGKAIAKAIAVAVICGASSSVADANSVGYWSYGQSKDPFTDEISHYAGTKAVRGGAIITVECGLDQGLSVVVKEAPRAARDSDYLEVTYRFDDEPAVEDNWKSVDGRVLLQDPKLREVTTGGARPFVEKLMHHHNMIIRTHEFGEVLAFSLRGSRKAIERALAKCE